MPKVYWTGSFLSLSSLAIVNRRLVRALLDRGNLALAIGAEAVDADALPADLRWTAETAPFRAHNAEIYVEHAWPPRFDPPAGPRYVHVQPWEFGSMPKVWYDALARRCDDVWTHSEHNRGCYVDAGLAPERVAVIPHGVDPAIFSPEGPRFEGLRRSVFRFLFVGGTLGRKGIDVVVNAYNRAFGPRRDVVLTIKDVDAASAGYRGQTSAEQLRALSGRTDIAPIEYSDATVPDEAMASLYRAADCLILPYRGEGFALPVLEAMACGIPVIVTAGGATDDFVDESVGWRIPSTKRYLEPHQAPLPTVTLPWLLEPQLEALIEILREVRNHPSEARQRGAAASERVRNGWTWDHAAQVAERRLREVAVRQPLAA